MAKYKVRIKTRRSLREQLQSIVEDYMRETGVESFDMESVAEWAVARGRYQREPISIVKRCKQELARACRSAHYTDPQGREVRRMHPARLPFGEDDSIIVWADITRAKPNHMRVSFQQRRQAIVADAKQHRTDVDSYNDNNGFSVRLPLFDYNINKDLAELDMPTDYPNEKPED